VDTTAAGDIFHGAFAYALFEKLSFWDSLKFANMTASLSVRVRGGRGSIPRVAEVREALSHVE
jgi:sugar/nucleoside kinase (ribokinase family)